MRLFDAGLDQATQDGRWKRRIVELDAARLDAYVTVSAYEHPRHTLSREASLAPADGFGALAGLNEAVLDQTTNRFGARAAAFFRIARAEEKRPRSGNGPRGERPIGVKLHVTAWLSAKHVHVMTQRRRRH
jgi:hypothetical protein